MDTDCGASCNRDYSIFDLNGDKKFTPSDLKGDAIQNMNLFDVLLNKSIKNLVLWDLNNDGDINNDDLNLLQDILDGKISPEICCDKIDNNCNGNIDE